MTRNYQKFGDMLLLDFTYHKNIYQVPLIVLSGVATDGRNIVFGVALVNDESYETYHWVFNNFLEINNFKLPNLCITDGDLSIGKTIQDYPEIMKGNFNRAE